MTEEYECEWMFQGTLLNGPNTMDTYSCNVCGAVAHLPEDEEPDFCVGDIEYD